jgi:hypothetical protein
LERNSNQQPLFSLPLPLCVVGCCMLSLLTAVIVDGMMQGVIIFWDVMEGAKNATFCAIYI